MRSRRRLRVVARLAASLLLCSVGSALAVGLTPLSDICHCSHGPDVDCDCPHHSAEPSRSSDENLPPCHRKAKRAHAAPKKPPSAAPILKARCGATLAFELVPFLSLPEPDATEPRPEPTSPLPAPSAQPRAGHRTTPKHPPRPAV